MDVSSPAWCHPDPTRSTLRLVQVPVEVFDGLARGSADAATPMSDVLTPYLRGADCTRLWTMRSEQLAAEPADAPWVTRLMLVPGVGAVGLGGFHGRPDARGMVEVGYRVDPLHRRRGFARATLEILLTVARDDPQAQIVRATISPGNAASRTLVNGYGFVEVGEQWDEEDGPETILEISANR